MAKSGIDYFPLDVILDEKFDLIEAEYGLTGFGVIVRLLQEIYGKAGYYIEWTTEVALLFARKVGLGGNVVSEIVEASIRRGMFDREKYDKYHVLTSRGIQKRYFEAVSRRKVLEVDENILLVNVALLCPNVDIRAKNVNIFPENANIPKQSKVEERRVKESKEEKPRVSALDAALNDFAEMRKKMRKPLTDRALALTLSELEKLAPDDDEKKIAILNQSIQRGWQGVFPLKDEPEAPKKTAPARMPHGDDLGRLERLLALQQPKGDDRERLGKMLGVEIGERS